MIKKTALFFICFVILSCSFLTNKQGCNPDEGNKFLADGKYENALSHLEQCESDSEASGLVLGQLAALYGELGLGSFDSQKERMQKVYNLYLLSAKKGNEDAVLSLMSIYGSGEQILSLKPDEAKAKCLQSVINAEDYKLEQVQACIK